jgi:hypothetical protein
MTGEAASQFDTKRQLLILLGIWLAFSIAKVWFGWARIADRQFVDPDDAMRLLQVRDWLAGQSWFDVTQYRLSPPTGGPMHWSRLVDLPIAAVILLVRPIAGQDIAETAALIAVPLLTLGVALFLVYRVAARLADGPAAFLAALATPASLGAVTQMGLLRIDHHGWQIVLALLSIFAVLDDNPRRSGLTAGAAMALWLNISIEGLPFTAAIGAWFAFQWIANPTAVDRLKAYAGFLAGVSLFLFVATHAPSTWMNHPHDALNAAHVAAFAVIWLWFSFTLRPELASVRARLAVLGLAAGLAVGAMFVVDPQWLQSPFDSLDPIVKHQWYEGIHEGLPVWRIAPGEAASALAQPLVGLVGTAVALWKSPDRHRNGWLAYGYLLAAVTLASVFVVREAASASVISMPGTAFLCELALRRARAIPLMPMRVLATAAAICVMGPAYAVPAIVTPNRTSAHAETSFQSCTRRSEMEKLRILPASNIAAPIDISPAILANTPHRAIAGGYHRNVAGLRDVILLFAGAPAHGPEILARRRIDYVVFCPNASETFAWAAHGPNVLAARLNAGRYPGWLEPVQVPGLRVLKVWRVRKDLLSVQARS